MTSHFKNYCGTSLRVIRQNVCVMCNFGIIQYFIKIIVFKGLKIKSTNCSA